MSWLLVGLIVLVVLVAIYDSTQRRHAVLRNFPVIGHFRYWLESIGPELRQYIVADNDEERPFSRDQRRWVYSVSKQENDYFGFGTDNDLEQTPNYLIIKHASFPLTEPRPGEPDYDPDYKIPGAKVIGEWRRRKRSFRPSSVINISGMSYGSLSGPATEALNRGPRSRDVGTIRGREVSRNTTSTEGIWCGRLERGISVAVMTRVVFRRSASWKRWRRIPESRPSNSN